MKQNQMVLRHPFASRLPSNSFMLFPLKGNRFEHQFGIRALPATEPIFLRTNHFVDEIALKRQLIDEDPNNYVAWLPNAESSMTEAVALICGPHDSEIGFVDAALTVQEDVVICSNDPDHGFLMIAGVVCFPSGWTVSEKIGMPIHAIHTPVPQFASVMGKSTTNLMQRLRTGRPVWRTNWGVRPGGNLDQSPKHADHVACLTQSIDQANAGQQCFFRVERQTLSRMPISRDILFTIHTMQCPVADLDPNQHEVLLAWLETCPEPTLEYKGIAGFFQPLRTWLQQRINS